MQCLELYMFPFLHFFLSCALRVDPTRRFDVSNENRIDLNYTCSLKDIR